MLEFYILLRAGNPDIASHILSNFYNSTRPEYYRQLDRASKERDLSAFIEYALQGYFDGLQASLRTLQSSMIEVAWKFLVHTRFSEQRYRKRVVFKRQRDLVLNLSPVPRAFDEITVLSADLARQYGALSPRTLRRDLDILKRMKIVEEPEPGKFRANIDLLSSHMPTHRRKPASAAAES